MAKGYYGELVGVKVPRKLAIKLKHILTQNSDADIEDVVRCKDCNGSYIARDGEMRCSLQDNLSIVRPTDFCSYGERKDDE